MTSLLEWLFQLKNPTKLSLMALNRDRMIPWVQSHPAAPRNPSRKEEQPQATATNPSNYPHGAEKPILGLVSSEMALPKDWILGKKKSSWKKLSSGGVPIPEGI